MTTTPPDAPTDEGPRVSRDEVRDLGRLRRSSYDRKVAGVAGGLARHLDIDPIILRVAFVVLAFFGGAGLILYGAAWLLVPEDGADQAPVNLDERSRSIALVAIAVIAALALVGDSWGAYWFPWPLAIIGLIAFVWLSRSGRSHGRTPPPGTPGTREGEETTPAADDSAAPPYYVAPPAPAYTPPPRDPRKRGPVLFWFTLALIAFAEGVLGIVDMAGAPVADSAYAALAVGVIAVMLIVGSVIGRAGGLIALGVIAGLVLAAATAADRVDGDTVTHRPTSAVDVQERYDIGTGELVLDLTDVRDVDELDGRTIEVSADAGQIEVVVPEDVDVLATADIHGPGGYTLFGRDGGGIDVNSTAHHDGGDDVPELTIDADISFGEIVLTTE